MPTQKAARDFLLWYVAEAAAILPVPASCLEELAARDAMQDEIAIERTGCFGLCSEGPILVVQPEGVMYTKVSEDDMEEIWESHVKGGKIVERLLSPHEEEFFSKQNRIALKNCGRINPERIEEYIALDGYAALAKAWTRATKGLIASLPTDSDLRAFAEANNVGFKFYD